jgi:hypothetical protein
MIEVMIRGIMAMRNKRKNNSANGSASGNIGVPTTHPVTAPAMRPIKINVVRVNLLATM